MLAESTRPNAVQRFIQRIAATDVGIAILSPILFRVDGFLMRRTNGRVSLATSIAGLPATVLLTTTGARTGQERTIPLLAVPTDDGEIAVVADNFGKPRHPAWYFNLRAHPEARVLINGSRYEVTARELGDDEREYYWQRARTLYLGYDTFRRRSGGREFPIMRLEPVS